MAAAIRISPRHAHVGTGNTGLGWRVRSGAGSGIEGPHSTLVSADRESLRLCSAVKQAGKDGAPRRERPRGVVTGIAHGVAVASHPRRAPLLIPRLYETTITDD